MKRLILPLIAAHALPTSVNAETVWLVLSNKSIESLLKIEMEDMSQCKKQGELYLGVDFNSRYADKRYVCLTGKQIRFSLTVNV